MIKACDKFIAINTLDKQLDHVWQEYNEIEEAFGEYQKNPCRETMDHLLEECTDAKTAIHTFMKIAGATDEHIENIENDVIAKNHKRNYFGDPK
jgi:hypothetical protein